MSKFREAFADQLKDLHSAESQIREALPKVVKLATDAELKEALEDHLVKTKDHIQRLDEILNQLGEGPEGVVCKGIQGLIEEGDEHINEAEAGPLRDAIIIASAQKIEHYEISAYGTARTWAEELGLDDAAGLLNETLDEEADADETLTSIAEGGLLAEGVNEEAAATR